jgi:myosin V
MKDDNEEIDDVKLRNDPNEAEVDNLINLPYLHEPAILYCLERRYTISDIYTYTGPILIAVNPFKRVQLYTNQILEMYYNMGLLKSQGIESSTPLPPHVYAIADAAYRAMMSVILNSSHSGAGGLAPGDQAILISGESGAGKTESTKIVLRYLTTVGSSSGGVEIQTGSVMDKVLQSNPILEAFGNAKTIRNENSSRFGKFIELNFNRRGHLVGGTIRTYLLEKVRLPFQQPGERNFHIFYQMIAGGSLEDRQRWNISAVEDIHYINQGSVYELQYVDDYEEYELMRKALQTLGFEEEFQSSLMSVMAGILHLGQLLFETDGDEGTILSSDPLVATSLSSVSELCGVPLESLKHAITIRIMTTRNETYEIKLKPNESSNARDALAKALYGKVFDWIVSTINRSIQVDKKLIRADISVLDIFGFECFKLNSFEQLCINYTNETLQQQFNQFVFKMEQTEYSKEKINWSFIEFPDNQDCLDLIEHKQTGIFAILDDECKLGGATDTKFHGKMVKSCESHRRFHCTPIQKRNLDFCINHYAGPVIYHTETFVEKNKDEFPREATALFRESTNPLIHHIFNTQSAQLKELPRTTSGKVVTNMSVGSQFREQLHTLMEKIYSTTPHYIRCLKPNDKNVPDLFDRLRTTEQLRYGGVLEAVRVARSGFPVRLTHIEFYSRYRPLANPFVPLTMTLPRILHPHGKNNRGELIDPKVMCEKLLTVLWDSTIPGEAPPPGSESEPAKSVRPSRRSSRVEDMKVWRGKAEIAQESVQLGLTKVFLRKVAHDILESRRSRKLLSAAKKIQCFYRGYKIRTWFLLCLRAVVLIQKSYRGYQGRSQARDIIWNLCACRIQKAYRCYASYWRYSRFLYALITLQSCYRRNLAQEQFAKLWFHVKGNHLKNIFLMLVARHRYCKYRHAVIAMQCGIRRSIAKTTLKQLRIAAKDVGRLQQSNEALKAEIEMLRAKAAEDNLRAQEKLKQEMEVRAKEEKAQELHRLVEELEMTKAALEKERLLREDAENRLELANQSLAQQLAAASKNIAASSSAPMVTVTPSAAASGAGAASNLQQQQQLSGKQLEEFNQIKDELSKEKVMREALETEILRLRQMAVDKEASTRGRTNSTDSVGNHHHHHQTVGAPAVAAPAPLRSGVGGGPKRRMSDSSTGSMGRNSLDHGHHRNSGSHKHSNTHPFEKATTGKAWDDTWDDESDDSTPSVSRSIYSDDSSAPNQFRSKKSFSEVPIPQQYQRRLPTPATAQEKNMEAKKLIMTFEKNLEMFKTRMQQTVTLPPLPGSACGPDSLSAGYPSDCH